MNWAKDVAHRIGLGGEVKYTMSVAGQTLHVPCTQCKETHDVLVRPGLPPEGIAGKMTSLGWRFGRKLACPFCAGNRKVRSSVEGGKKTWAGTTPEQRREAMAALSAKKKPKEETPVNSVTSIKPDLMATTAVTPPSAARPSDSAKRAHRLLMQALEDYYDDAAKKYRPGHTDKSVATETGASEQHVKETREQYFGPLGEPSELEALRKRLGGLKSAVEQINGEYHKRIEAVNKDVDGIAAQIDRLCIKNGWSV